MTRRCGVLIVAVVMASTSYTIGQPSPATRPDAGSETDVSEGRRLLEDVRDNEFTFDDPAFYWYCRFVGSAAWGSVPEIEGDPPPVSWGFLLERPSDYRGELIVLEGTLQARSEYEVSNRLPGLRLYQSTLSGSQTRSLATVVTTSDPGAIPIRSRVRVRGYFIKSRSYTALDGAIGAGPLIVARELRVVVAPTTGKLGIPGSGAGVFRWLAGATGALAIVWLIVRSATRRAPAVSGGPRRPGSPGAESDGDFDWLTSDSGDALGPPDTRRDERRP